jgi:hypothetical protein
MSFLLLIWQSIVFLIVSTSGGKRAEEKRVDSNCQYYKRGRFLGQRPLVPLLLLGPPFLPIILFGSTILLTGMTGISLHMQLHLTSQSQGR